MNTEGFLPRSTEKWSTSYYYQLDPDKHIALFKLWEKWGSPALVILTKEQILALAGLFDGST